ncbi:MAG: polysaccharide pyruvyl transferase family protein [Lachnospiraceae bacterium]
MKIALLHGASINAGDFLILSRTKSLLNHFYPKCSITEYYRNQSLNQYITEINQHDILIFAGGPGYYAKFYPDLCPLTADLNSIKIPIMFLGMGWFGYDSNVNTIYNYNLGQDMPVLLQRAIHDTKTLGCRDFVSMNILRNNGIDNSLMTGCPAWYDLNYVNQTNYKGKSLQDVNKICISDCGNPNNYNLAIELCIFIKKFFGDKEISFVCHRGFPDSSLGIDKILSAYNINYTNISNSEKGFEIYNACDLHIGFRVHAHIYNLSKRKLSILIEEDGRGYGVNQALGLPSIQAYISTIQNNKLTHYQNDKICLEVEDYLMNLSINNYIQMDCAFYLMNRYFENMKIHINSIEKYI